LAFSTSLKQKGKKEEGKRKKNNFLKGRKVE
jgi:hypothetical protein